LGFGERVNRKGDDVGILLCEFSDMGLEVGYLPNAIGSPDTAIENDNSIFTLEIGRDIQPATVGG
jgi:hypothetical protein